MKFSRLKLIIKIDYLMSSILFKKPKKVIDCFCDASANRQYNHFSVIAFKVGDQDIVVKKLNGVKAHEAEVTAATTCIAECRKLNPGFDIHLFTDCLEVVKTLNTSDVQVTKVPGHWPNGVKLNTSECTDAQYEIYRTVDMAARKRERELIAKLKLGDSV
jgi:hypothetical protein